MTQQVVKVDKLQAGCDLQASIYTPADQPRCAVGSSDETTRVTKIQGSTRIFA